MKISILTPSYNQGKFIEENILSVLDQSLVETEHIVMDGGSTDSTMDILKKYPHLVWVSEKDEGQADALQKGLEMATGDIIAWINSDDYLEKDVLERVEKLFVENDDLDWVIGNITFLDQSTLTKRPEQSKKITKKSLLSNPDILRQQATFFRKDSLLKVGGFRKEYHLTMDLDLWFRMLKISDPRMVNQNLAYFRLHEDQKTSGKHTRMQLKEMLNIFRNNDAPIIYKLKIVVRKLLFAEKMRLVYALRQCRII
jgi:glycosyltransferase involved in cell wall biosynthesis